VSGEIILRDGNKQENILKAGSKRLREIRGSRISMIFQEPSAVLDPLMKIGDQIVESIMAHRKIPYSEAKELAIQSMEKADITCR